MARGEDESWFKTGHTDAMGVRSSDGEDNRWLPSRKVEGNTNGVGAKGRRGTIMDQATEALCCCGPRWGRKYNSMDENSSPPELRTKGRWQVDEDDEYYKPPVWKQIMLKVKAQARQANCGTNSGHWENYDSQSYEKNFDNGGFDENNEKLGLKERAMLQTLASSRSFKLSDADLQVIIKSKSNPTALSPLPVNRSPPKPKDEFVPIWQRRASSPVTLDVRHRA